MRPPSSAQVGYSGAPGARVGPMGGSTSCQISWESALSTYKQGSEVHLSLHVAMDLNLHLLLAVLGLNTDSVLSPSWTAWGSITWESALRAYRRSSQVHLSLHPCAALIAILVWLASVVVLTIGGGPRWGQDSPRWGQDEAKMGPP